MTMTKYVKRPIVCLLPLLLLVMLVQTSCEEDTDQNLFSNVTLIPTLSDGRTIVRMEVDTTLTSTYFRNINNSIEYDFPIFANNRGTVRVQKGVYLISFDATASFSDGSSSVVRCSEHAYSEGAVSLLNDSESVVLNLTIIN